ncbi:hypothetical protein San01_60690 [Streptomyces angustmyceticus]|uniref:Uncharacterized protein n=1 Tax=Streptomyces angustmyceticus TaxID=285578 RepID=A0A5J4LNJ9_9ACTN|nr:hypothetical protein San01_60690 [Streptomyces angustmyceticus]
MNHPPAHRTSQGFSGVPPSGHVQPPHSERARDLSLRINNLYGDDEPCASARLFKMRI